ncbi:MAG TPA: MmgE/PrpD family protein [Caulobacteraceae bacterium]|nr:MmgE/PrpD family protein [Caulobacteraceae bacterium]
MTLTAERPPVAAEVGLTAALADRVAALRFEDLPEKVVILARQCLLDWLGVSIGARREPLVEILLASALEEAGPPQAALIGRRERLAVSQAALINGAMGHALDYDDVNSFGHPTAPVAPAALALGEKLGASGAEVITAFVAGYETETRVSRFMGPSHYDRGWHATSTFGAFGAAAAAARLMDLAPQQVGHAFGLAGTQAAGLKSMFGTMAKPLHPGLAAVAGLRAADLAGRGFTSNPDVLETAQGFGATQSERTNTAAALAEPGGGFHILANLFKYHAACYLTHSTIEAMRALRLEGLRGEDVAAIRLEVAPTHLKVCDIAGPRTGLEVKFSIRFLAALALLGADTSDEGLYTDATAARADAARLAAVATVVPTASGTLANVEVDTCDGRTLRASRDVGVPETDLASQQARLEAKFARLTSGAIDPAAAVGACMSLPEAPDLRRLLAAVIPGSPALLLHRKAEEGGHEGAARVVEGG